MWPTRPLTFLVHCLQGWRIFHVQLQPGRFPWRRGGHLCFEKDLFSHSALVSQRGYLWGQLHGGVLCCIFIFITKTCLCCLITLILHRFLWGVMWRVQLRQRETTGILLSKLYVNPFAFWEWENTDSKWLFLNHWFKKKFFPGTCFSHLKLAGDVWEIRRAAKTYGTVWSSHTGLFVWPDRRTACVSYTVWTTWLI